MDQMLLEVALQLGATLELEQLTESIVTRVVQLLQADRAFFLLYAHDDSVEQVVTYGFSGATTIPPGISKGILEDCRKQRKAIIVPDTQASPDYHRRHSVQDLQLRFLLAAPVILKEKLVGILYVDSRHTVPGNPNLERTLMALCRMIGMAIENARLFEDQRFRNTLLSVMTYDLNNLLTVIHSTAQSMAVEEDPALQELVGAANAMQETLESACVLAKKESQNAPSRVMNISAFLYDFTCSLRYYASSVELRLEVMPTALPPVWAFQDRLRTALWNLFFTISHYANSGTTIQLESRLRADPGPVEARTRPLGVRTDLFQYAGEPIHAASTSHFVEISFSISGLSLEPALLALLFQGKSASNRGLGLSIVDTCVRSMGGLAWAESVEDKGVRFAFSLATEMQ
jgi:signal transduction histidine kinase